MAFRASTLLLFLFSLLSLPALAGELPLPIGSLTRLLTREIGAEAAIRILSRTSLATASREAELRALLSEYCDQEISSAAILALKGTQRKALAERATQILAPGETFEVLPKAIPRFGFDANLGRLRNIHKVAYVDGADDLMTHLQPYKDGDVTVIVRHRDTAGKLSQTIGKVKYFWPHFQATRIEILAAGNQNVFLLSSHVESILPALDSGLSELRLVQVTPLLDKPVRIVTTGIGGKELELEGILEQAIRAPDKRLTHVQIYLFSAKQTQAIPVETISTLESM